MFWVYWRKYIGSVCISHSQGQGCCQPGPLCSVFYWSIYRGHLTHQEQTLSYIRQEDTTLSSAHTRSSQPLLWLDTRRHRMNESGCSSAETSGPLPTMHVCLDGPGGDWRQWHRVLIPRSALLLRALGMASRPPSGWGSSRTKLSAAQVWGGVGTTLSFESPTEWLSVLEQKWSWLTVGSQSPR